MFHSHRARRNVQGSAIDGETGMDREDWLGDELPSFRADTQAIRESTGIRVKGSAGFLKGELQVVSDGSGQSPQARAVTMLIVAVAAGASSVAVGVICFLAHMPATLLGVLALITFAGILVTGLILAFRQKPAPAPSAWPPPAYDSNGRTRVIPAGTPPQQRQRRRRSLHK